MRANIPKGMGGGPQNMQGMMRQVQKMQENMVDVMEMEDEIFPNEQSGDGKETVVVNDPVTYTQEELNAKMAEAKQEGVDEILASLAENMNNIKIVGYNCSNGIKLKKNISKINDLKKDYSDYIMPLNRLELTDAYTGVLSKETIYTLLYEFSLDTLPMLRNEAVENPEAFYKKNK